MNAEKAKREPEPAVKPGKRRSNKSRTKSTSVETPEVLATKAKLAPFLKNNPHSTVKDINMKDGESIQIVYKPWGDRSVAFKSGENSSDLFDALNSIILPPRLTALYHIDTKVLEVIWTAYNVGEDDLVGRSFSFALDGVEHTCSFEKSSDRLLVLADHALYLRISSTSFRNLQSFSAYIRKKDKDSDLKQSLGEPLSFFIKDVEWNEEETLALIRHINFYMRYYDSTSPHVLIHPPEDDMTINPRSRYISGKFPEEIQARKLNETLLAFWLASAGEDAQNQFLLYYRILEFVTSSYLDAEQRSAVRKILSSPNIASSMASAMDNLVGLIREERPDSVNRFVKVVKELVDDDLIWKEICLNPDAFTQDTVFDGGFKLRALVGNTSSRDAFGPQGMDVFARTLRKIRNALAHGGEAQSGQIILPTAGNIKKLQPWVHLVGVAAGEVVLYEHLT